MVMDGLRRRWQNLIKNPHFKYGSSFLTFMVVGVIGLREFAQVRYDIQKKKGKTLEFAEEYERHGLKWERPKTIEEEFEEFQKVDLDSWYNIRGPRPGEDSRTMQNELRQQMSSSSK